MWAPSAPIHHYRSDHGLAYWHRPLPSDTLRPIMNAQSFARDLLFELKTRDPRAAQLTVRGQGDRPVIGIVDEGEYVPLLSLGAPSKNYNVMSLFVRHQGGWQPTFKRGTPKQLAEELAGPFHYLWTMAVDMAGDWMNSASEHSAKRERT